MTTWRESHGPRYQTTLERGRWTENHEHWGTERLALEFWTICEGYVYRKWGHRQRTHAMAQTTDLQGVALEALLLAAEAWPEWCTDNEQDPTEKRLFWWIARQRVDWAILAYLDKYTRPTASIETLEHPADDTEYADDWVRTQLSHYSPPSTLHAALAEFIPTLRVELQLYLALYYFEELPQQDILTLVGGDHISKVTKKIRTATTRILNQCHQLVFTTPPAPMRDWAQPYEIPAAAADWISQRYGVDPHTYLDYVNAHYRADVGYLIAFIQQSNGQSRSQGRTTVAANRTLSDDDIRTIRDLLTQGQHHRDIADQYGVGKTTVTRINKRILNPTDETDAA